MEDYINARFKIPLQTLKLNYSYYTLQTYIEGCRYRIGIKEHRMLGSKAYLQMFDKYAIALLTKSKVKFDIPDKIALAPLLQIVYGLENA